MGEIKIPNSVLIAGIFVTLIVGFAIYVICGGPLPWRLFATVIQADPSTSQFAPISQWTKPAPVDGATCHGYAFQTTSTTDSYGVTTIHLGSPSLGRIDPPQAGVTYYDTPFECMDTDTINAIQEYHTCTRTIENGAETNDYPTDLTQCPTQIGTNASYGETETFYQYCPDTLYCNGQIGSISVGYAWDTAKPSVRNFSCLQKGTNDAINLAACNLALTEQQFRLVQNDAGGTITESKTLGNGMDGTMLRIQYRGTGQCVDATTNFSGIFLNDCTAMNNNGFVWGLIPSVKFNDPDICLNNYPNYSIGYTACITSTFELAVENCTKNCINKCKSNVDSCSIGCKGETCGTGCCDPNIDCHSDDTSCLTGCIDTNCDTFTKCLSGCTAMTSSDPYRSNYYGSSPPQIVYIGDADYLQPIPIYDPTKLSAYLRNINAKSMYQTTSPIPGKVQLGPFRYNECNVPLYPPAAGGTTYYDQSYCTICADGCTPTGSQYLGPSSTELIGVFLFNTLEYRSGLSNIS